MWHQCRLGRYKKYRFMKAERMERVCVRGVCVRAYDNVGDE